MTTAQKIAGIFRDDGTIFETADGRYLDDIALEHGGCRDWKDGWKSPTYRWDFRDGSCITVGGAAWDHGYQECFCWSSCGGHQDECTADLG